MQVLEGVFSQDQIKAYFEGNFLDESCRAVDEEHEMGRNGAQRSVFGNKTPMSWERLREQQGYGGVELSELRSGTSINGSSTPRETSRDHVIDHITLRRLLSESAQIIAERQPEPFGSTIRYNEDMEEEAN
ncbi:hypothetical protein AGDE_12856 [Angomonas deanei]|uniref:Uncharacterized protein n=1 Tax=Angomonas deanei TaxID=59799 RepID=A0A7G2CIZ2_9TRYP|nr:hypothetical protein AGDE_12856 [Angomonas deanei]CAD2218921.1 hypothetical protein, conserved [Angomonas deanei]|eukprot:EPY23467.1 hypothetical protein AGDE_12856 [Angomonas deanei]